MTVIDEYYAIFEAQTAPFTEGVAAMTAAIEKLTTAVTAGTSTVVAETDRMGLAMREAAVAGTQSAEEMALQGRIAYDKLAASAEAASLNMQRAAERAAAANDAMALSIERAAAKAGEANLAMAKKFAMAALGAGIVAGATVKMAADFETSTTRLVTSAGETQANLGMVRDGILALSGQVGDSSAELAKAMYTVESGGQHGADGLLVLKAAAEGAAAEGADLTEVADAVTSVLQDYHLKASDAALVTSKLVTAVGAGKTTFQQFSSSLSSILPIASSAGISLDDITGALASMTVHGMSASQASQNLADVVRHMVAPTQVQTKELGQLGISSADLADKLSSKGLTGTLQELSQTILNHMGPSGRVLLDSFNKSKDAAKDADLMIQSMPKHLQDLTKGYAAGTYTLDDWRKTIKGLPADQANLLTQWTSLQNRAQGFNDVLKSGSPAAQTYQDALRRVTGDATGLNTALMLTGENTAYVNDTVKKIGATATETGNHVKGWADIQETFNNKMHRAKEAMAALGIEIGEKLLPAVSEFVGWLATGTEWLTKHKTVAEILAVALGVLAAGFLIAASAIWVMNIAMLANPITWIVLAVVASLALLIFVTYELVQLWKKVWPEVKAIAVDVWHWLVKTWDSIAKDTEKFWKNDIVKPIEQAWKNVKKWIGDAVEWLKEVPGKAWSAIKALPGVLENAAKAAAHGLMYQVGYMVGAVYKFFRDLPSNVEKEVKKLWDGAVKLTVEGKNAVVKFFVDLWHSTVKTVESWWKEATKFIDDGVKAAIKFVKDLPGKIEAFFVDMWHKCVAAVTKFIDETVAWFKGLPGRAETIIKELPKKIKDAVSDAGSWLVEAGKNIVQGAIDGIGKMFSKAVDAIKGLGHSITKGFNDAVGNKSPSKQFAEAGKNIVMGLVQGIQDNAYRAAGAVTDMAESLALAPQVSVQMGMDGAAGIGPNAGGGGQWRAPAQRSAGDQPPIKVEASLHLDGKEIYRGIVPYAQQHKGRNNTTALG